MSLLLLFAPQNLRMECGRERKMSIVMAPPPRHKEKQVKIDKQY